jgi:hypothetical protein
MRHSKNDPTTLMQMHQNPPEIHAIITLETGKSLNLISQKFEKLRYGVSARRRRYIGIGNRQ